jgi:hypothetical protein
MRGGSGLWLGMWGWGDGERRLGATGAQPGFRSPERSRKLGIAATRWIYGQLCTWCVSHIRQPRLSLGSGPRRGHRAGPIHPTSQLPATSVIIRWCGTSLGAAALKRRPLATAARRRAGPYRARWPATASRIWTTLRGCDATLRRGHLQGTANRRRCTTCRTPLKRCATPDTDNALLALLDTLQARVILNLPPVAGATRDPKVWNTFTAMCPVSGMLP